MSLNIYFSITEGSEVSASVTEARNRKEVERQLEQVGSDHEMVLEFVSLDGEGADAIASLTRLGSESDNSFCHTIENLVALVYSRGVHHGVYIATGQ